MAGDWQGANNPAHQRRLARWVAIEAEFGEPLRDVIVGLREQGNSWRTVAGTLDVSLAALQEWRKALGLPLDTHDKLRDPSSHRHMPKSERRARELGYPSLHEALLDMRVRQRLTIFQIADRLGVHYGTVSAHMPRKIRGKLRNRSPHARAALQRRNRETRRPAPADHPWREDNEAVFR